MILLTLRGSGTRSTAEIHRVGNSVHAGDVEEGRGIRGFPCRLHVYGQFSTGQYLDYLPEDVSILSTLRHPALTACTAEHRAKRTRRPADWVVPDIDLFTRLMPLLEARQPVEYRHIPWGGEAAGLVQPRHFEQVEPYLGFWSARGYSLGQPGEE